MAIRKKGIIPIVDGEPDTNEFGKSVEELEDGEYGYLLFDKEKNRTLPQLKYLNGIVLKAISDELPDHPAVGALYRYFEELYAPILSCEIQGQKFEYFDLKRCKSSEMERVLTDIIQHAKEKWNIDILSRDEIKLPSAAAPYEGAYANQWQDYSRTV